MPYYPTFAFFNRGTSFELIATTIAEELKPWKLRVHTSNSDDLKYFVNYQGTSAEIFNCPFVYFSLRNEKHTIVVRWAALGYAVAEIWTYSSPFSDGELTEKDYQDKYDLVMAVHHAFFRAEALFTCISDNPEKISNQVETDENNFWQKYNNRVPHLFEEEIDVFCDIEDLAVRFTKEGILDIATLVEKRSFWLIAGVPKVIPEKILLEKGFTLLKKAHGALFYTSSPLSPYCNFLMKKSPKKKKSYFSKFLEFFSRKKKEEK